MENKSTFENVWLSSVNEKVSSVIWGLMKLRSLFITTVNRGEADAEKMRKMGHDCQIEGKPDSKLSHEQLQLKTAIEKHRNCMICLGQLKDEVETVEDEMKEIRKKYEESQRLSKKYTEEATKLAKSIMG